MRFADVIKGGAKPPAGYKPMKHSSHGGWVSADGKRSWYPTQAHADKDHDHHHASHKLERKRAGAAKARVSLSKDPAKKQVARDKRDEHLENMLHHHAGMAHAKGYAGQPTEVVPPPTKGELRKMQQHVMREVRKDSGWEDYKRMGEAGRKDLRRIEVTLYDSPAAHDAALESGDSGDILDWAEAKDLLRPGMSLDVHLSVGADELPASVHRQLEDEGLDIEDVSTTISVEIPGGSAASMKERKDAAEYRGWTHGELDKLPHGAVLQSEDGKVYVRSASATTGFTGGHPDLPAWMGKIEPVGKFRRLPADALHGTLASIADVGDRAVYVHAPTGKKADVEALGEYLQTPAGRQALTERIKAVGGKGEPDVDAMSVFGTEFGGAGTRINIPLKGVPKTRNPFAPKDKTAQINAAIDEHKALLEQSLAGQRAADAAGDREALVRKREHAKATSAHLKALDALRSADSVDDPTLVGILEDAHAATQAAEAYGTKPLTPEQHSERIKRLAKPTPETKPAPERKPATLASVRSALSNLDTYMSVESESDAGWDQYRQQPIQPRIHLATRANGDVGAEHPGGADIEEAKRVARGIVRDLGEDNVSVSIDTIDEWTTLDIELKGVAKTKAEAVEAAGLAKRLGYWYPADRDGEADTSEASVDPVNINGKWRMITRTVMGGGLGTVYHEYKPGLVDPVREGVPYEYSKKDFVAALRRETAKGGRFTNLVKAQPSSGTYAVPAGVKSAAKRGLELRKRQPKSGKAGLSTHEAGKQGIGSGVARARDLMAGRVSKNTIKRMHAYFSRHAKNYKLDAGKQPHEDKGYVAGLLWGGEAGRSFAAKMVERFAREEATKASPAADITKATRTRFRDVIGRASRTGGWRKR